MENTIIELTHNMGITNAKNHNCMSPWELHLRLIKETDKNFIDLPSIFEERLYY